MCGCHAKLGKNPISTWTLALNRWRNSWKKKKRTKRFLIILSNSGALAYTYNDRTLTKLTLDQCGSFDASCSSFPLLTSPGSFLWASVQWRHHHRDAAAKLGAGHMYQCQQGCQVPADSLPELVSFTPHAFCFIYCSLSHSGMAHQRNAHWLPIQLRRLRLWAYI